MKFFKKIGTWCLAFALVLGAGLTMSACTGGDDSLVMNVSVNPSVEFILDKNDVVLSVTASNEDGAYLLSKFSDFAGMNAEDAALKVLELSEQYGFVVKGSANGEEIEISISGSGAKSLYNEVKEKISEKATDLGIAIDSLSTIDKEDLQEMVAECYQEFSEEYIENLDRNELLNLIKESREETKNLFTIDEKQAYYRERAQEVISAKLDAINEYLDENPSLSNIIIAPIVSAMNTAYTTLQSAYETLNQQIEELYTNAQNGIDGKLQQYIAEKEAYLQAVEAYKSALAENDANVAELKATMESLKAEAETLWNSLESARENAVEQVMNFVETTIHTQLTNLNTQIESLLEHISLTVSEIENAVDTQLQSLKTQFENASTNPWTAE